MLTAGREFNVERTNVLDELCCRRPAICQGEAAHSHGLARLLHWAEREVGDGGPTVAGLCEADNELRLRVAVSLGERSGGHRPRLHWAARYGPA